VRTCAVPPGLRPLPTLTQGLRPGLTCFAPPGLVSFALVGEHPNHWNSVVRVSKETAAVLVRRKPEALYKSTAKAVGIVKANGVGDTLDSAIGG
jgi:hypothetical protein